ncbi:hypothetical protein AWH69_00955 [Janibacter melonis]|uniref:Uncharacterized protein n=1 Tax=Janibacter melonis TaxID=262209 RepID=A0A176QFC2_9MICO|nr:hypothetical protein AWH69_00955 [Janibacter melonis]
MSCCSYTSRRCSGVAPRGSHTPLVGAGSVHRDGDDPRGVEADDGPDLGRRAPARGSPRRPVDADVRKTSSLSETRRSRGARRAPPSSPVMAAG